MTQINLGGILVEVIKKDIKNVHLSVYPPSGRVRISAPLRMKTDTIRVYAISKLDWIKQQQKKIRSQARETHRDYIDRESHFVWGKRYLLKVVEHDATPSIELKHSRVVMRVRPGASDEKRREILEDWYREQLRVAIPGIIAKWQSRMGVSVNRFFIQRMRTKWGSCNPRAGSIRLNTELAKKPIECLEYVVVHEMAHLIEPTHNSRFIALMDQFMPKWEFVRNELNRLPVRHEDWRY